MDNFVDKLLVSCVEVKALSTRNCESPFTFFWTRDQAPCRLSLTRMRRRLRRRGPGRPHEGRKPFGRTVAVTERRRRTVRDRFDRHAALRGRGRGGSAPKGEILWVSIRRGADRPVPPIGGTAHSGRRLRARRRAGRTGGRRGTVCRGAGSGLFGGRSRVGAASRRTGFAVDLRGRGIAAGRRRRAPRPTGRASAPPGGDARIGGRRRIAGGRGVAKRAGRPVRFGPAARRSSVRSVPAGDVRKRAGFGGDAGGDGAVACRRSDSASRCFARVTGIVQSDRPADGPLGDR